MNGLLGISSQEQVLQGMLWIAALVAVLAVTGGLLGVLRRRLRASGSDARPEFTLDELRRMRDRGDLTIQEYERLAAKLAEKFKSLRPKLDIYPARGGAADIILDGYDGSDAGGGDGDS